MVAVALITVALMALALFAILYYLGVFVKVKMETKRPPFADCKFLYKFHRGPYHNAGKAFDEVAKLSNKFNLAGIYFDDPKVVASQETCYAVGIMVEKEKSAKEDVEEIQITMKNAGFKTIELPAIEKAVCSSFPFKPNSLCILVAVAKIYSAFGAYTTENKLEPHPCLEYYKGDKMFFVAPLEKNDAFYVPEYDMAKKEEEEQLEKSD